MYYLENTQKKLVSQTLGSLTAKGGKATQSEIQKLNDISNRINKLSPDKSIAQAEYNVLKEELKKMPSPSFIKKSGKITSGVLTAYGTACGLYEIYEDVANIAAGNDLVYDTLNLSWHSINVVGSSLSLFELATNIPNAASKVLSHSSAVFLLPQAIALGYEWGRDNALYEQVDNVIETHANVLFRRHFSVAQIVKALMGFGAEMPLDDLRYSIIGILDSYPNVYRNDGTLFDADVEFVNYLSKTAFLKKQFNKSSYEKLTPSELATVAAVYVLGEAATWENMSLKITTINNLTKLPVWSKPSTWGDFLPAAFSGKDSFTVFSELRSQVISSLDYDVYDNLRTTFNSLSVKAYMNAQRQIGEKIHYYETP